MEGRGGGDRETKEASSGKQRTLKGAAELGLTSAISDNNWERKKDGKKTYRLLKETKKLVRRKKFKRRINAMV